MTDMNSSEQTYVKQAADGTPLREDGTPYPEMQSRRGQEFAPVAPPTIEQRPDDAHPGTAIAPIEYAPHAEAILVDPLEPMPEPARSKVLYVQLGEPEEGLDKIPFVCLPSISAFAELRVVKAQVAISENVEAMKNSPSNQSNGRLAVETLEMLFNFFAHYMYPSELERMRHLMGDDTETFGAGRIMQSVSRDNATEAMKDLLGLYGGVETVDPKDGAVSSDTAPTGIDSTTSSPS